MVVTQHSDYVSKQQAVLDLSSSTEAPFVAGFRNRAKIKTLPSIARLLSKEKRVMHAMESSCNGLIDAAAPLFAMLGMLKTETTCPHEEVLRREFLEELNRFEKRALQRAYPAAYLTVCRYVLCATIDDVLAHEVGFEQDTWEHYALLNEKTSHDEQTDKFFAILARASDSPTRYIDLLELMYLALSYGYQGELRYQADGAIISDRIRNHLYERIRKERGQFSQRLLCNALPNSKKETKPVVRTQISSILFTFILTLCIIMMIFIGLNYIMDVISNEAYRTIVSSQPTISHTESIQ